MYKITCDNVLKNIETKDQAIARLTKDGKPVNNEIVVFTINGKQYDKVTDNEGIARIGINLDQGLYRSNVAFKKEASVDFEVLVVGLPVKLECYDTGFVNGDGGTYTGRLTNGNDVGLGGFTVKIDLNGKTYERTTNNEGYFGININLNIGVYPATFTVKPYMNHVGTQTSANISVSGRESRLKVINPTLIKGEKHEVQLTDKNSNPIAGQEVVMYINGKRYEKFTDYKGIAWININLYPGTYKNTYHFVGNAQFNRIDIPCDLVVKAVPAPAPAPTEIKPRDDGWYLNDHYATKRENLAQITDYDCGPNSIKLCIYNLIQKLLNNRDLMNYCGTTTAGTGHPGLEKGISKSGSVLGVKFRVDWYNLSDVGWDWIGKRCKDPKTAVFLHLLYKNLYGHYENVFGVNPKTKTVGISNSLSDGVRRGWLEYRSFSTCESYMRGISQKSVCIITFL